MANPHSGILLIDKPIGPTSFDIVALVRREFKTKKVGHAGTLDPMASGLLIVCIENATKLVPYLMHTSKEYSATVCLGMTTNTDDAAPEHKVIQETDMDKVLALSDQQISYALTQLADKKTQRPPRFSALKAEGVRLYDLARKEDASVEELLVSKERPVDIQAITIQNIALPFVTFTVRCGAGTYIRSIARDLGNDLGVGGHLTQLRRTKVGPFSVEQATRTVTTNGRLALSEPGPIISPLDALAHLQKIQLSDLLCSQIRHGVDRGLAEALLSISMANENSPLVLLDESGGLLAIATLEDQKWVIQRRFSGTVPV